MAFKEEAYILILKLYLWWIRLSDSFQCRGRRWRGEVEGVL